MKKILVLTLLLASSCAMADPFEWITGIANDFVDDPIDTYAKTIVAQEENVDHNKKNEFMFDLDVRHREMSNANINEPLYYCTTVTMETGKEYRMAILDTNGTFKSVLEGEFSYMALCSPHTTQGQYELEMIVLKIMAEQLLKGSAEDLKKQLDIYL